MSNVKFRFRSFASGVLLASLTWMTVMYLYWNLNSETTKIVSVSPTNDEDSYIPLRQKFLLKQLQARRNQKEKQDEFLLKNGGNALHDIPGGEKHIGMKNIKNYYNRPEVVQLQNSTPAISSTASNSVWKAKFQKLIQDQAIYKNSDLLVSQLSKTHTISEPDDKLGLVQTVEEKRLRERGFRKYAFNALISYRLGVSARNITDTRHERCTDKKYPEKLPRASVIICFYNEEFHVLLRTVHSVLKRSNPNHLHEILLIDDFSDIDNINEQVTNYKIMNEELFRKVVLLKTPDRAGLIRARNFGAKHAKGDVLVFLDSHVEVNENWLDPLLTPISQDRKTVTTPIIDIINADTFTYLPSPLVRGGFNWGLHFRWDNIPRSLLKNEIDFIKPIDSPTMAGGLFAMDKSYFYELGEYDEGMEVWGGENLEISFRIWMCGGRLQIIPCSRVGHVFRRRRPYGAKNGEDTILINSVRVAEVWLDDYKENFYKAKPSARSLNYGDISARVNLRKQLKCKPFKWYMDNIYPEIFNEVTDANINKTGSISGPGPKAMLKEKMKNWKTRSRTYISRFQLNLKGTRLCVQTEKSVTSKNAGLILQKCFNGDKKQRWLETEKREFILAEMLCLDADNDQVHLSKCHEMQGTQEWKRSSDSDTSIYNLAAGQCLGIGKKIKAKPGTKLTMEICDEQNPNLKFDLLNLQDLTQE